MLEIKYLISKIKILRENFINRIDYIQYLVLEDLVKEFDYLLKRNDEM